MFAFLIYAKYGLFLNLRQASHIKHFQNLYDESYIWGNSLYESYTSHTTANNEWSQFVWLTYAKFYRTAILGTEESGLGTRSNQGNHSECIDCPLRQKRGRYEEVADISIMKRFKCI